MLNIFTFLANKRGLSLEPMRARGRGLTGAGNGGDCRACEWGTGAGLACGFSFHAPPNAVGGKGVPSPEPVVQIWRPVLKAPGHPRLVPIPNLLQSDFVGN